MNRFWLKFRGESLGRDCRGAVNALSHARGNDGQILMVDPRYFAVMALCTTHLGCSIVSHESVHAGFAYAKRVRVRDMWPDALKFDEENVAYPAGAIAGAINNVLHDSGMYAIYEGRRQKNNKPKSKP